jgi:hypothetical protein
MTALAQADTTTTHFFWRIASSRNLKIDGPAATRQQRATLPNGTFPGL